MLLALALLTSQSAGTVWIEGESPTTASVKYASGAPGRPELLSGGRWLAITGAIPDEGATLVYDFKAPTGKREIWHRVGYEAARSPFDWRVDGGAWHHVEGATPTTDLTELATWNGVAWMNMGSEDLAGEGHKLEIHIPNPKGDALYGSDAFAIVDGPFHPYGKWQPGQDPRTERDLKAEVRSFAIEDKPGPERQTLKLDGDWEIARDDEIAPALVATPMTVLDPKPVWTAISVPGDKAAVRPDLILAHRVWYRTRFTVPVGQASRSFNLTFRQNSLNTTVLVNGKPCGFNKNPFVKWSADLTSAVHPGTNELLVGIRDAWYGYHQDPKNPAGIRTSFAIPLSFDHMGFSRLDYPVWGCFKSGLLVTPELTVGGRAFASDVFVKPSVAKKEVQADVTLHGSGPVSVTLSIVDPETGKVVQGLASSKITLDGEKTVSLGGSFLNPTLWWPDRPKMYTLRTTIFDGDKTIDISDTPFGFREWTTDGPNYRLNGVIWHGWAELTPGDAKETWLANYRKTGQRFVRIMGPCQNGGSVYWHGMPFDEALDWCDANGVNVRRCGPLDGEAIGYMAIDDQGGINKPLLQNVRDQMVAQVMGERNHPSINVWSVENEWLFINCINLYGGLMDEFERDMAGTIDAVHSVDPTRLAMTDGGGAGKANILPIHGDHYVYTNEPSDYPNLAYTDQPNGGGRGRWTWDGKRPRYAGEDFFATGINPADYAWIQGEEAFGGKTEAQRGMAMVQRMITEGYRWSGAFTGFHLWVGDEGKQFPDKYMANAERAVFVRQYDSAFSGGTSVIRTLGVFNDSRFSDPLTVDWSLTAGGKTLQKGTKTLTVAPGMHATFNVNLTLPTVTTRTSAKLNLNLLAAGKPVFKDQKPINVLPSPLRGRGAGGEGRQLAVYDPSNKLATYLTSQRVIYRTVKDLKHLPQDAKTLLVGPDAIPESASSDPALAAYGFDGHRVIVLEQSHPLKYGALPTDLEPADKGGAFGFAEDATHPVLAGLTSDDLRAWGPNARLYDQPYRKAIRGIRSLVEVGPRLTQTALAEVPVGKGVVLLSQLQIGHNLAAGGPARTLLANLINYAGSYRHVERPVRTAISDPVFAKALDATGVRTNEVRDPLATLQGGGIAVVSATAANLKILAANLPKVRAFTAAGGSLVVNGLTPEGLADYNKIVGVDHLIRHFRREKTALATPRDPLAAGLTQGDVVMYSSERIFDFNSDMFVASDIFRYVVDTDDVAPFAALPNGMENTVNGFVSADGWKYIFSFTLKPGEKPEYTMTWPKTQPFRELTWIGNGFYHKVTKIGLSFDGGPIVPFDVQPNIEPQTLTISPARTAKSIRLVILEWTTNDGATAEVVGIDNIYFKLVRPAGWFGKVKPLMNVGGLVRYPQGKGNIVLANMAFLDKESIPENAGKKRAMLATVLRNLGAGFSGGANVVVPGAKGIVYTPISLAGKATAYRNDRGWFGEAKKTLADLPTGRQVFGSVPFDVYDFPTSPVPTAVVLGGPGVPGNLPDHVEGIKVGTKASALFFLQTARIDQRRDDRERRENKRYEMARYVVTYADGSVVRVPIVSEVDVDDYRQTTPHDLPGARLAWSKPFAAGDGSATAYLMQWTNPRPEVAIETIGLEYGPDRRGVPALLAVTAAK
jgi:hypothetical protein